MAALERHSRGKQHEHELHVFFMPYSSVLIDVFLSQPFSSLFCLTKYSTSLHLSSVSPPVFSISLSVFLHPLFVPLRALGREEEKVIDQDSGPAGDAEWLEQTER